MSNGRVLDAALVEDLHRLALTGSANHRIEAAVRDISELTLTGLVEYGCLRWHLRGLPMLPASAMQSRIGTAIVDALSPEAQQAIKRGHSDEDYAPRVAEFVVMSAQASDLLSERAKFLCIRFARSAQHAGFQHSVSHCLQAGLQEMMDNAVRHSKSTARIVAGYHISTNTAEFVVVDVGQGVLASLRQSEKYAHLRLHAEAINLALHDGVTSDPDHGGRGFNDIFKALTFQWGLLRFRSGEACVTVDGRGANADSGIISFPPFMPGFQVSVKCRNAPEETVGTQFN